MAQLHNPVCGPCDSKGERTSPTTWCTNCEEGLCTSCSDSHGTFKSLQHHTVVPFEYFTNLPKPLRTIDKSCSIHGKELDLFCGKHQEPCCCECVAASHSTCSGINLFSKVAKGIKTSDRFRRLNNKLQRLTEYKERLKENRHENTIAIEKRRKEILVKVKELKDATVKRLDELDLKIQEDLETTANNKNGKIIKEIEKIDSHSDAYDEVKQTLDAASNYASEEQVFQAVLEMEALLSEKETELKQLSDTFQNIDLTLDVDDDFERVLKLPTLGTVGLKSTKINVQYECDVRSSPQMESLRPGCIDIDLIRITKLISVVENDNDQLNTRTLVKTDDGKIITVATRGNENLGLLCTYSEDGECLGNVECSPAYFGFGCYGQTHIASSIKLQKCFYVQIGESNLKVCKTVLEGNVHGISISKCYIAMAVRGNGIVVFDKDLIKVKEIPIYSQRLTYVHVTEKYLFYSDFGYNRVICLNINGEELWSCSFQELKGPRNLCTDMHGMIYVAALDSNAVFVISPDGKKCRKILDSNDGLREPKAIYFRHERSQLIVANRTGKLFICNIVYR